MKVKSLTSLKRKALNNMTTLTSFVLIGTVLSYDSMLATLEFQMNPPQNGDPSIAIMPINAIPCNISVGKKVYVVKEESQEIPVISCEK